jgi:hypothetical protein
VQMPGQFLVLHPAVRLTRIILNVALIGWFAWLVWSHEHPGYGYLTAFLVLGALNIATFQARAASGE